MARSAYSWQTALARGCRCEPGARAGGHAIARNLEHPGGASAYDLALYVVFCGWLHCHAGLAGQSLSLLIERGTRLARPEIVEDCAGGDNAAPITHAWRPGSVSSAGIRVVAVQCRIVTAVVRAFGRIFGGFDQPDV